MNRIRSLCNLFLILLFLFPISSFADLNLSISGTVTGGNGQVDTTAGSGGGNNEVAPTDITFSGLAYPNAKIFLLAGGIAAGQTYADPNASFSLKLPALDSGVKIFSLVAVDTEGVRSVLITLPITIASGTTTTVSRLFLPPTLSLAQMVYGRGEDVAAHGYSVPWARATLIADAKDNIYTMADKAGFYSTNIKTDSFLLGEHTLQAKVQILENGTSKESGLGRLNSFIIALNKDTQIEDRSNIALVADINRDSVIDIKDFSILAFWFSKPNVPKNIDINGDRKITIADFSILAYYWNG